jgi:hypothetical protein
MNRQNDAFLGMYKAVKQFLDDNAATITAAGVPIINTYKTDLEDQITAIEAKSPQTAISSLGITQTKKEARFAAIKSAAIIAGAIYSYAVDTNNTELAVSMNITPATLKAKKDEEVVDYLHNIWAEASELVTVTPPAVNPLANYGVGTAEVTALEGLINAYTAITTAPRLVISTRKTNNLELASLYDVTDALLFKTDKIVDGLEDSYPSFFQGYKNARIVILISKSTRIAGVVSKVTGIVNGETTTALANGARITVIPQPYVREKNGQTISVTGKPEIVYTNDGDYTQDTPDIYALYTVICKLEGYAEQQFTDVRVKKGKKTTLNILLEPIA